MTRTARCCCGSASITVKDDPVLNGVCHCDDCKRRTGGAFGWNAYFPEAQILDISGDWVTYEPKAQPGQIRRACKHCSSMLWWTIPTFEGKGVAAGAFIDHPLPEPTCTYQHADHMSWFNVPANWDRVS